MHRALRPDGSKIDAATHLPGIHGLRGIAAVAIVFFHVAYVPSPASPLPPVVRLIVPTLGMGVYLFFILSAFSLLWTNAGKTHRPDWLGHYLIKRFFRIAPLFYFMVFVTVALQEQSGMHVNRLTILQNLLFIYNFLPDRTASLVGAGWTLGVEMPFYFIFPILIISIKQLKSSVLFCGGALLFSGIARLALADDNPVSDIYAQTALISYIGVFAIGVLVFHIVRSVKQTSSFTLKNICAVGFTLMVVALWAGIGSTRVIDASVRGRPDLLFWSLSLGMLCIWQILAPSRWLATTMMQWVGERSFSIYLTHAIIIYYLMINGFYQWVDRTMAIHIGAWTYLVSSAAILVVVLACSIVTYRVIEVPGQSIGRRWIGRPAAMPVVAGAVQQLETIG